MSWTWIVAIAAAVLVAWPAAGQRAQPAASGEILVLDVDGAIGPATTEYVRDGLAEAKSRGAALVVLRMDTPGGLDSATRNIVADILASPVPVATFVSPPGARAASAGTYILFASHLAVMAPGTHLGAATPVSLGGGGVLPAEPDDEAPKGAREAPADAMSAKVVNDAAAYIASLAALHGRNAEWAERAVREAATLTAEQAEAQDVIEYLARDLPGLRLRADGRTVRLAGSPHVLHVADSALVEMKPGWRIRALAVITNPNIAYLLLLAGVYGLIFEFISPGSVGPGVVGAVALLVALFALDMLPVNYAGLALLLLGVGLMTAEAVTPSIGVLGVGGAVAFGLGSVFLFKGPVPELRISPGVIAAAAGLSLVYFVFALGAAVRAQRGRVAIGPATFAGAEAQVLSWSNGRGLVLFQGETWQASSSAVLSAGASVHIAGRHGLELIVEPGPDGPTSPGADPVQP